MRILMVCNSETPRVGDRVEMVGDLECRVVGVGIDHGVIVDVQRRQGNGLWLVVVLLDLSLVEVFQKADDVAYAVRVR